MKHNNKSPRLKEWIEAGRDVFSTVVGSRVFRAVFSLVLVSGLTLSMFYWGMLVERGRSLPTQQTYVAESDPIVTERTQDMAQVQPVVEPDDPQTPAPQPDPIPEPACEPEIAALPVIGTAITGYDWVYSSVFGDWRFHHGVDISADLGAHVKAALSGHVVGVEDSPVYGRTLTIDHGSGLSTVYACLDSTGVEVGEAVVKNQVIGLVGQSGTLEAEFGPHLHFEVWKDGMPEDPGLHIEIDNPR